jgi:hypothetical protein
MTLTRTVADASPMPGDRWSGAWALTIAAFLIGFAIQIDRGRQHPAAMLLLSLALPLAVLAVLSPDWRVIQPRNVRFALALVLALQFGMLAIAAPGTAPAFGVPGTLVPLQIATGAAGILAVSEVLDRPVLARWRMPTLIAFWAIAAAWVIALHPLPPTDVWWFQQIGGAALMQGIDPYAIRMPNIYAPDVSLYAPGMASGGQLDFGYPYMPLSLLLTVPALILLNDVRFAHLAVVLIAAILIARMRPGPISRGAALLFLFTPRSFYIIEHGWIDPQTVLGVALIAWVAIRRSAAMAPVAGLAMALKQYLALLLPVALLLLPRSVNATRSASFVAIAVAVALVVTLPLVIWDVGAFWHSAIELQVLQPFRTDALSYLAMFGADDPRFAIIGFAMLIPTGFVVWRYAPRTPAGFAAGTALIFLFFFAFNKQAFANYYYFVIGAMCCAIAATWPSPAPPEHDAESSLAHA